ncbi:MAG: family 10 glycosylhydrolase [Ruminiclostridium sp.]|nr:family 10 glycosylhydrolase [Ruminiclostridium sp.]
MKSSKIFCSLIASLTAFSLISGCKSSETANTAVTSAASESSSFAVTAEVRNGDFGGIALESCAVTAASAAPVPESAEAGTDISDIAEEYNKPQSEAASEETTTSASAVTAQTTTTTAAQITTTAAQITTIVQTTTTAQTTTAAQTTTTAAATTTAAPAPVSSGSYGKNSYKALNHSYVKAVWISYIELYNHLCGKNESAFRQEFGKMLDNCAGMGVNTVYVHVRAFGDAYFYSSLFPFTKHISGTYGRKTGYDPLKIMVSEAHSRNISFHAWINPLRLGSGTDIASVSAEYPVGKWYNGAEKGKYVVNVNGAWYLNPAYEAVRKLIGDNVREIVSGYNVDGVHIDDYFYPTTDASFDSAAFSASGSSSLSAFRISNVNAMVREMHDAAHECGSAIFGAAPQGNNINNLNQLYADVKAWCKGGYVDYFTPQIYYGFENSGVPFKGCVNEWAGIVVGTKTKLYAGLAVYKIGNEDKWAGSGKYEWQNTTTMLKRQKEYADANGCSGIALYSYAYMFDSGYKTSAMKTELDNLNK